MGREELKVKSISDCAMLEEDAMHIGTVADVSGYVLDINGKKTQLRGLMDTGAVSSVIPIETWNRMGRCNSRLLKSHLRLKKNRAYVHWLKSQGHYLLCFFFTSNGRSRFGSLATLD